MTVARLGERGVIGRIVERFSGIGSTAGRVELGPGDDAALLRASPGKLLVVTSDLLIERTHFRLDWTPAALLGHKALAVNLSDLAAMGAEPQAFLLNLGLPSRWPVADLDAFLDGMARMAARAEIALAGGDTSASDRLHIGITALGTVDPPQALRRDGARPGDQVAVTGALGASAAGLALLGAGWRLRADGSVVAPRQGPATEVPEDVAFRLLRAHLAPEPEVLAGQRLARIASAGLDVSDGLAQDLHNLCDASSCGAVVETGAIPVDEDARVAFVALGRQPLDATVEGGEDYRLLVTLRAPGPVSADGETPLTPIGTVVLRTAGVRLASPQGETPLPRRGYEHFPHP